MIESIRLEEKTKNLLKS